MNQQQPINQPVNQAMASQPMPRRSMKWPWITLVIVVVAVLAVLGIIFRGKLSGNSNVYQAVFLTNGQVYFGKLSHSDENYVTLKDIYYLQVNQPLQSGQTTTPPTTQAQPQLSLVKLGNELHGPVDIMHISRQQILFFEDLKNDGQVVTAIHKYQQNQSNPQPAGQGQAPTTGTPAATTPSTGTTPQ